MEWLISIRKKFGLSRRAVAQRCFISESYYQKIEYGERSVSVPVAKRIAAVLSFDWQRFFDEKEYFSNSLPDSKISVSIGKNRSVEGQLNLFDE